jgi:hypothetical protein
VKFAHDWDFDYFPVSPGHSNANGKVESAVKTAKNLLKKAKDANTDPYLAILDHRNTPSQATSTSPAQKLMNRRTKTLLPTSGKLLEPRGIQLGAERERLKNAQLKQADSYNRSAKDLPSLEEGDVIRMQPFKKSSKEWQKGMVTKRLDERSYEVETRKGTYRRNRVHLRKTKEDSPAINKPEPYETPSGQPVSAQERARQTEIVSSHQPADTPEWVKQTPAQIPSPIRLSVGEDPVLNPVKQLSPPSPLITRSGRISKRPHKLNL